jgi:Predicted pyridoxal phosphate-dependent enzyme apparently involved in regulation of cell wall biogenesis
MPEEIFDHKFVVGEIGYKLKPLDLQGAKGLEQNKRWDRFEKRRKENFESLDNDFKKEEDYFMRPKTEEENKKINGWGFVLTLKEKTKFNRHDICDSYEEHKKSTRTT